MRLSDSASKILLHLKSKGPQTAVQLAAIMGLTSMGVRKHLTELENHNKVKTYESSEGVGRPKKYWALTESANSAFPDTHAFLTVELIDSIQLALGSNALDKIITQREQTILTEYQQEIEGLNSLEDKVKGLVRIRKREGYMAEYEKQGDGFLFIENHCPICVAARKCQGFCRSELSIFKKILGPNVQIRRVQHIISGDRRCAYSIQ